MIFIIIVYSTNYSDRPHRLRGLRFRHLLDPCLTNTSSQEVLMRMTSKILKGLPEIFIQVNIAVDRPRMRCIL